MIRAHPKPVRLISSVALRAGLLSTLWMSAVLITLVTISAFFYRDANERNFERLLNAHLYSLIAAVSLSTEGTLQGEPDLGDIRYHDPASGWYWEVILLDEVAGEAGNALKSPSLLNAEIASPSEAELPFDNHSIRLYRAQDGRAQDIWVVESDIVIEAQNHQPGWQSRIARFRVMGNSGEVEQRLDDFWSTMRGYLAAFIGLSALINGLMIILGMKPLIRIKSALSAVRTGQASHIDIDLPLEIQPMAREMNALIDNQHHMIERFRTQLGNLAHAMKTPLAIVINEANKADKQEELRLILEQAHIMQEQIQHHLQRAQMAAQRDSLIGRTDIQPIIARLVRVMNKLFPDKQIHSKDTDKHLIFAGEAHDLEEIIGNLLENASKWAKSQIVLRVQKTNDRPPKRPSLQLIIEDDGVGLSGAQQTQVLQRGRRLDESVPGSGLGLSIVAQLVQEYNGELRLDQSALGGLRATITLPLAIEI